MSLHAMLQAIRDLHHTAQCSRKRYLIIISGEQEWSYARCEDILQDLNAEHVLSISSHDIGNTKTCNIQQAKHLLGQEYDFIVYDARSGFFPDIVSICEGTLVGGGLFFLLCPKFEQWPDFHDAFAQSYAMYPHTASSMESYFLQRFISLLKTRDDISTITANHYTIFQAQSEPLKPSHDSLPLSNNNNQEQQDAIEQIKHSVYGHRNRPLIILADRGRGKSSALGIASAQLMNERTITIIVTAMSNNACKQVFKHAREVLSDAKQLSQYSLERKGASIRFIPPDELLRHPQKTGLLLIDEAAAIPQFILEALVERYHRVVMCSTAYGYEGNGRRFELKFIKGLQKKFKKVTILHLHQAVRWCTNDPLESFFSELFISGSVARLPDTHQLFDGDISFCQQSKQTLIRDEKRLRTIFRLLTQAHYKTTPNDLRMMLDSPFIDIYTLTSNHQILAVALIAIEGKLPATLCREIYLGNRRLTGHVLPQSIMSEFSGISSHHWTCARIIRIAVNLNVQRKGLGSQLLQNIEQRLKQDCQCMGASFANEGSLIDFWTHSNYRVIKIGYKRHAASGQHSVIVLKALDQSTEETINFMQEQFQRRFLYMLADNLSDLDIEMLYTIARPWPKAEFMLTPTDIDELTAFAHAHRSYSSCALIIHDYLLAMLSCLSKTPYSDMDTSILIRKNIQNWPDEKIISAYQLTGKSVLDKSLRQAVSKLLNQSQGLSDD